MNNLKSDLVLSENRIEIMSNALTTTELEKETKHRELEKEYSIYTKNACLYIADKVKNIKHADFMQRRITYEGWKYMAKLTNKLIREEKNDG